MQVLRPHPSLYERFLRLSYVRRKGDGGDQCTLRALVSGVWGSRCGGVRCRGVSILERVYKG